MPQFNSQYPDFKPMLSGKFKYPKNEIVHLRNYPYITSPKVDGFRCVIGEDGTPYSRKLIPIPNVFIKKRIQYLSRLCPELKFLDGELLFGPPDLKSLIVPNVFQKTSSAVTTHAGEPTVTFWYFDRSHSPNDSYQKRFLDAYTELQTITDNLNNSPQFKDDPHHKVFFRPLPYAKASGLHELEQLEDSAVEAGFEGLMFRNPNKPYKFGRSAVTKTQQHLIKLVRWESFEGVIIDTVELQHNDNELTTDELGYAKRSSSMSGKVGGATLGKFVVTVLNGPFKGESLRVGTGEGLTHALRSELWNRRSTLPGLIITGKYRSHGSKDLPRFPIYKSFRDPIDF